MTPSGVNDMGADLETDAQPNPEPKPAAAPMTVPIPLAALAEPDDKEEMMNPEQGDIVDGQFEGKIVSVNGDVAMVAVTSVNGKPLAPESPDDQEQVSPEDQDAAEYSQLEGQAGQ